MKTKSKRRGTLAQRVRGKISNSRPSRKNVIMQNKKLQKIARKLLVNNLTSMSRMQIAQSLSGMYDKYDIDTECGYPKTVTAEMCKSLIERDGLACQANSLYAKECFSVAPVVYETEDVQDSGETKFEKAWVKLEKRFGLREKMARADEIVGYGCFGGIMLGFSNSPDLAKSVCDVNKQGDLKIRRGPYKLLWVLPLDETQISVESFDKDPNSYRFGLPLMYNVKFANPSQPEAGVSPLNKKVHWSRIIHIADNCKAGDVFGQPRIQTVFNYLLNLRKILGGSAEMLWKGGFPGFSFEVPPELAGEVDWDSDTLIKQLDNYFRGFQRYIASEGLHANVLQPNIAEPTKFLEAQILAICVALGVPMRVFMGTEEARLASIQDSDSWNKKVHKRQDEYVSVRIIRPLVDRLIVTGVLPAPKANEGEYNIYWPDLYSVSDADKANIAKNFIAAVGQYQESGLAQLIPPQEFWVRVMNYSSAEAASIVAAAEAYKKKLVKLGAIDKAGRPLPSKQEMQMAKQQMQMKLKMSTGKASSNLKQKTGGTRSRAQSTRQRAKTTGKAA